MASMQATTRRSHGSDDEDHSMDDRRRRRDAKRKRTTRKGTHSCWACKRRKEKCSPDPLGGDACHSCRRRGTKCVSQEFPEEASDDVRQRHHVTDMGDRMRRIESIVEQLLSNLQPSPAGTGSNDAINSNKPASAKPDQAGGLRTPISLLDSNRRSPRLVEANDAILPLSGPPTGIPETSAASSNLQDLSQALHRSLPCRQDMKYIRQASSRNPTLMGAHMTRSYTTLQRCGLKAADGALGEPPPQTVHPVLLARYLLQLAMTLQDMHQDVHPELRHLSESPSQIMERSASAAMTMVTTRDELHGSIESLECVMLESAYRCISGHLRLSWMAVRRAMLLAQVMGLHLAVQEGRHTLKILDPKTTHVEPRLLWFRIVSFELLMCRLLGLPPGTADPCPGPFGNNPDTALGYLEQKHCEIMAKILKRRPLESGLPDFETTLLLDQELQKAATTVTNDWWLAPHLTENASDPVTMFWDFRRLLAQITHYDLFNQLYLPFMLAQGQSAMDRQRCNLSRIVCVNSSREVLSRYIALRNFNQVASSCRVVDFTGLMAAITLVLAHLGYRHQVSDNISSQAGNLLSHQAPSDRAMMEKALENMRQVSRLSGDALVARSADVLHRLLEIEAKRDDFTAKEHVSVLNTLASNSHYIQDSGANGEDTVRVDVPYFGYINIARESVAPHPMTARTKRSGPNSQSVEKMAAESCVVGPGFNYNDSNISPPLPQSYDTLLPGLNDEYLGFQNIHMSCLDNFFDDMPGNEVIYNV